MAGNIKNLKPLDSNQSREKAKENGRKGGIASGKAKREKKLVSEMVRDFLGKEHIIKGKPVETQELLRQTLVKVLQRGGMPAVKLVQVMADITEGAKFNIDTNLNINTDDEKVKAILAKHGIQNIKN